MAQRLYTEWFVKFKFPGHENVKMVDSLLGKIPEGWEIRKIKDLGVIVTGKTPSTSKLENFGDKVPFIKTPDIHGNIFILITQQRLSNLGANSQKLKTIPAKTVFVSCIGTLGLVGITSTASQTNQQINAVVADRENEYPFIYFLVKSLQQKLRSLGANGATMGNVNKEKFENINFIYPEQDLLGKFSELSIKTFEEILNLQRHNKNVTEIRDLLIPQLVTGRRNLKDYAS